MEKILYAAMCAVLFFVVVLAMNTKRIPNLLLRCPTKQLY